MSFISDSHFKCTDNFSKRAILNVGMLLRDSDVAKEIRSRLLDIAHDSETESGSIKTIITEIDEERSLMLERVEAEMQGDYDTVIICLKE